MQFPLRDFFWLSLVIGLAIGIAMEHKRVVALSVHEGRAQWWQKAAEETAERLEKATGESIQFQELKQLDIDIPARVQQVPVVGENNEILRYHPVAIPGHKTTRSIYGWETRERRISFLTGMMDLDMWLFMLSISGLVLVATGFSRKADKPLQTIFSADNPLWQKTPWLALFWIPFGLGMSLLSYWQRNYFNGAAFLTLGVFYVYGYCQYVLCPWLNPPPQAAVQTSEG